jgi:hypothetical protein
MFIVSILVYILLCEEVLLYFILCIEVVRSLNLNFARKDLNL